MVLTAAIDILIVCSIFSDLDITSMLEEIWLPPCYMKLTQMVCNQENIVLLKSLNLLFSSKYVKYLSDIQANWHIFAKLH